MVAERRRRHRARRGPALGDGQRAAGVPRRDPRPRAQPGRARDRRGHPRRLHQGRRGPAGPPDRRDSVGPGRRRLPRPGGGRARRAAGRQGRHRGHRPAGAGAAGPLGGPAGQGEPAAADRHQGDRRDDPGRARPAGADHRRPADRQDRHRHRHHHQPEVQLGVRRPGAPGQVHLRGGRPEGLHHRAGAAGAGGRGRDGVHHHRRRPRLRPGRLQVHRPLHRVGDRPALDVRGPARADHLRRPVQAGRGVPGRSRCCCAARPAARPTPATSSTCTPGCSSGAPSCRRSWAAARSPACRSSRPRPTTSPPTFRPMSSPSPTARSSWRPTCSTPASGRPSTSAGRCPGSAATRRSRR